MVFTFLIPLASLLVLTKTRVSFRPLPRSDLGLKKSDPLLARPAPVILAHGFGVCRIPKSLVVYYGLNNDGCESIAARLSGQTFPIPIGVSIAKTNCRETADEQCGINDYVKAYRTFVTRGIGQYFTINISCPNAFGGEPFVAPNRLDHLLERLRSIPSPAPLFLKLPADLSEETP